MSFVEASHPQKDSSIHVSDVPHRLSVSFMFAKDSPGSWTGRAAGRQAHGLAGGGRCVCRSVGAFFEIFFVFFILLRIF